MLLPPIAGGTDPVFHECSSSDSKLGCGDVGGEMFVHQCQTCERADGEDIIGIASVNLRCPSQARRLGGRYAYLSRAVRDAGDLSCRSSAITAFRFLPTSFRFLLSVFSFPRLERHPSTPVRCRSNPSCTRQRCRCRCSCSHHVAPEPTSHVRRVCTLQPSLANAGSP